MHRNESDCRKLPQAAKAFPCASKRHSVCRSVALHLAVRTVALIRARMQHNASLQESGQFSRFGPGAVVPYLIRSAAQCSP